jgi:hypothetical protein
VSAATRTARLVADEQRASPEAMTARAALRRPRHPRAIGAADQIADCGHDSEVRWDRGKAIAALIVPTRPQGQSLAMAVERENVPICVRTGGERP